MLKNRLEQESICKLFVAMRDYKQNIYCVQYNLCFVLTFLCVLAYKGEFFCVYVKYLCICKTKENFVGHHTANHPVSFLFCIPYVLRNMYTLLKIKLPSINHFINSTLELEKGLESSSLSQQVPIPAFLTNTIYFLFHILSPLEIICK